jgi:hypothetical protein
MWEAFVDHAKVMLNNNRLTGRIPQLRPDSLYWVGSVTNVRDASTSMAANWTALRQKLPKSWCAHNAATNCKDVKDSKTGSLSAACNAECLSKTTLLIPQKQTQDAGWHIWNSMCKTGLSFGPGIHEGICQVCEKFEPAGCDKIVKKDTQLDSRKCKCASFTKPSQSCIDSCIRTLCENVFQDELYCQEPKSSYLSIDLSANTWLCPAPILPPGDNGGFTRELSKQSPFVNPVYQTADCTCPKGWTCKGDGRNSTDGKKPTMVECRAFCRPCQKGYIGTAIDAHVCHVCPNAHYSDQEGSTVCQACPVGRYGNPSEAHVSEPAACGDCQPGTYQPNTGRGFCEPAPKGTYAPSRGMNSTLPCAAGTYSDQVSHPTLGGMKPTGLKLAVLLPS